MFISTLPINCTPILIARVIPVRVFGFINLLPKICFLIHEETGSIARSRLYQKGFVQLNNWEINRSKTTIIKIVIIDEHMDHAILKIITSKAAIEIVWVVAIWRKTAEIIYNTPIEIIGVKSTPELRAKLSL